MEMFSLGNYAPRHQIQKLNKGDEGSYFLPFAGDFHNTFPKAQGTPRLNVLKTKTILSNGGFLILNHRLMQMRTNNADSNKKRNYKCNLEYSI